MPDITPIVLPPGELHWVNISGQGKLNYNEDGYDYVATEYLPKAQAEPIIEKIKEVLGDTKGLKVQSLGYRELHEDEEGNLFSPKSDTDEEEEETEEEVKVGKPSGIYAFTFKTNTTYQDGKTKAIGVFDSGKKDADGKVIQRPKKVEMGDRRIGNGSLGAISGKMKRYVNKKNVGVSLFLHAIQLTKFVEYVDGGGFGAENGEFDGSSIEGEDSLEAPADNKAKEAKAPAKTSKPRL